MVGLINFWVCSILHPDSHRWITMLLNTSKLFEKLRCWFTYRCKYRIAPNSLVFGSNTRPFWSSPECAVVAYNKKEHSVAMILNIVDIFRPCMPPRRSVQAFDIHCFPICSENRGHLLGGSPQVVVEKVVSTAQHWRVTASCLLLYATGVTRTRRVWLAVEDALDLRPVRAPGHFCDQRPLLEDQMTLQRRLCLCPFHNFSRL